ncbi:hypothetical protein Tco_1342160, partial [Tanacetum coccineum]
SGPNWLFDIDALTKSINYKPIVAGNQSNDNAGTKDSPDDGFKPSGEKEQKDTKDLENESEALRKDSEVSSTKAPREDQRVNQEKDTNANITNNINTVSLTVNEENVIDENIVYGCADDLNMPELEEIVYSDDDEDVGAEADMTNLDTHIPHEFKALDILSVYLYLRLCDVPMDFKSAFLMRRFDEEVYVGKPLGFEVQTSLTEYINVRKDTIWAAQATSEWYATSVLTYFCLRQWVSKEDERQKLVDKNGTKVICC